MPALSCNLSPSSMPLCFFSVSYNFLKICILLYVSRLTSHMAFWREAYHSCVPVCMCGLPWLAAFDMYICSVAGMLAGNNSRHAFLHLPRKAEGTCLLPILSTLAYLIPSSLLLTYFVPLYEEICGAFPSYLLSLLSAGRRVGPTQARS